jgi:hypothetical protein
LANSQTITFDCTGDGATGAIVQVWRVSGMKRVGSNAVRQTAGQSNRAGGIGEQPVATFGDACETGNPTLATVFKTQNTAVGNPAGWTEGSDIGFATPAARGETVSRDSGFTGTQITWPDLLTVTFCDLAVELTVAPKAPPNSLMLTGSGI